MKRMIAFASLAIALTVAAFAQVGPVKAKGAYCNDCCKGHCGQSCCQDGCTDSCCQSK
jgi:hypothetical protein